MIRNHTVKVCQARAILSHLGLVEIPETFSCSVGTVPAMSEFRDLTGGSIISFLMFFIRTKLKT